MTADNCAIGFRVYKIIEKLKIPPEAKFEEFLTSTFELSQKMGINPEILRDALIEFAQISEKVHFSDIPRYLQEKRQEIQELENKKSKLNEEIQILENEKIEKEEKTRSSLKDKNTTLFHLDIFVKTKNKLEESYGIIVEDIDKFTRCVQGIKSYSNYDPFKVIEKFSNLNMLEIEIENKQNKKTHLEKDIQKLEERESEYNDRLNLKFIKLKNLDELEKTVGFNVQDLKKIKRILIGICSEYKITNIEQIKLSFFELLEKFETKIELERENNRLLDLSNILQNQIETKRQALHCQVLVGPILKNLSDAGIREDDIINIKAIIDILFYEAEGDIAKSIEQQKRIIKDLANYKLSL